MSTDKTNPPEVKETHAPMKVNAHAPVAKHKFGDTEVKLFELEHDGHMYLMFMGMKRGGMIHSASCPCRKKKGK